MVSKRIPYLKMLVERTLGIDLQSLKHINRLSLWNLVDSLLWHVVDSEVIYQMVSAIHIRRNTCRNRTFTGLNNGETLFQLILRAAVICLGNRIPKKIRG
jgi:hypothetical protein